MMSLSGRTIAPICCLRLNTPVYELLTRRTTDHEPPTTDFSAPFSLLFNIPEISFQ